MMTGWIDRLLPAPASAHAAAFDGVLKAVHVHALLVLAAWLALFVLILVRFRAGAPRAAATPLRGWWPYAAVAAVLVGDVLLLAGSALPVWQARAVAAPSGAVEIRITAEQFAWNVHYAGVDGRFGPTEASRISASDPLGVDRTHPDGLDDIVLINVLQVPRGRPVAIHLSARDVIHSFSLPQMRVKQDVVPGLPVTTWFEPVREGQWEIVCSQLCGLGHYRMRGQFAVLAPDAWQAWVREESALAATP
jgi:cytochrome c oxidase subunit 2